MKVIPGLIIGLFISGAAFAAAAELPSQAFEADNYPPEAMPVSICGIHESHTGRQDCYQLPGSHGEICYDRSCGCHVVRSPRGCDITCNISSCQGE